MTELVKYEAAKVAIAEAKSVDEVKKIHDVAAAMKAYAKQANDRQMECDASEIRIRAERRLGEMIRTQKETVGLNTGGWGNRESCSTNTEPQDVKPTLADVGIDKKLSSRAQAIAAIPEDDFEETLAEHREEQQAVTARTMETLARKGAHVMHNSGDNEWYTPEPYIEAARAVMGGIDTDPASHEEANKVVKATEFFTAEENGLHFEWVGRVFLNPPYEGKLIVQFMDKLDESVDQGVTTEAVVLVNNATETRWFAVLASVSACLCFPTGRIKFWHPRKESVPLQGQCIAYIGANAEKFMSEFRQFGIVTAVHR